MNKTKELKDFEMIVEDGILKGCLVYHESVKQFIVEALKAKPLTPEQEIYQDYETLKAMAREDVLEEVRKNIGQLRQAINEDRITDINKMISNEYIERWLGL